ncbi:MAG: DUF4388 domain-containing protein [Acidobacteria bacterium]|nr:DUF4388 domain-containing protein [Acidobacteriota bacterium]
MSANSAKSLFKGDLSQTPLPEVLVTIHRYKVPGVVECVRGDETRQIFIDEGNIIFATSTNIDDSLGVRLLKQGLITNAQFDESVTRLKESGAKRQGVILVEMRAIEPKQLFVSVKEQVQDIVWSVFEWAEGSVSFQPGRERAQEFIKLNIPTRQAVIQGVRRIADARTLVNRMGKKATILAPVPAADFSNLTLTPEEQVQYELVDGTKALYELIQYGPLAPAENAKILYALYALKLIQVKELAGGVKVKVRV